MLARIRTLTARRDAGASAVEYGLLVAAIAAVIITVVVLLGGQLNSIFTGVNDELGTIPGGTGGGVTTGG
ncbi:Flp family type IVb pilin [Aquipuribacter nitratireducens]|uniref:Flp family type IVb pilin n=2 Tax=Aquipuribacter nitratireducens TaxID=650104 RepID=A0ABW0GSP7_9MICO